MNLSFITGLLGTATKVGTSFLAGSGLWWLIGAGYLALLSALGVQTVRVASAQTDTARAEKKAEEASGVTATVRAQWALQVATLSQAAAASQAEFRAREEGYQDQIRRGYDSVQKAIARNEAVLADVRSKHAAELRTLAAYANPGSTPGSGGPSPDTLAACQRRADALGDVLAHSLRVQVELGAAAELEAARVGVLLDSWPVAAP